MQIMLSGGIQKIIWIPQNNFRESSTDTTPTIKLSKTHLNSNVQLQFYSDLGVIS